jgi:hypothetical protein
MELNRPLTEQLPDIQTGATTAINNVKDSVSSSLKDFSTQSIGTTSQEFINSNSIISKFVFLVLILILFIVLMNLGIFLINYILQPSKSPYVIKGIHQGTTTVKIPQDPKNSNAVTIYRSNNADNGIEFTWTVWINIDKLPVNTQTTPTTFTYKNIFTKGSGENQKGPSVSLKCNEDKTGSIVIAMDSVSSTTPESIDISNIPLGRWFNLAIRMQNKIMDVYVNGTVAKRYVFSNIPRQNFGDVIVGDFDGTLSDLRYFDSALNVFQLNNIAMSGPNLTEKPKTADNRYDYLSSSWYSPS